ncbi:type I restriction enzyme HsdR N-terminal domain-containing protein [Sinorhizobium meliloti]|uniref:type I restriction enzyme HsdR N-terminal domain-containing protein n=1 Tax=Rhizobium meliloti TaxID=382 RepID=UPI0004F6CEE0|nr:type I restriction enzyme HsdR N-terminal domain-containing protein [Sinorhizobium meliloti]AIL98110.1 hypothetical protein DU99_01410 [Sinorhizobium meliloti]
MFTDNPNYDAMNETDVREVIVRPLLHEIGYRFGTDATIRTEVILKYDKAFLGRKKPTSDVPLASLKGRADYICEVVSVGRWVVEVKAPNVELSPEDAQQAHTYAAHPEIAGLFYLITNGREFALYRTSYPDAPLIRWSYHETQTHLPALKNVLAPHAIRREYARPIDLAKPLGQGVPSKVRLFGGVLTYNRHWSDNPLFATGFDNIQGFRATISGGQVFRDEGGRITASVEVTGPNSALDALTRQAGMDCFAFHTSDEYVSTDVERPTIFQNFIEVDLPAGTHVPATPTNPEMVLPIPIQMLVYSTATGAISGEKFIGILDLDYTMKLGAPLNMDAKLFGEGEFSINLPL